MITGISYVYFIALVCALRLFSDCTATDALSSISQSSTAKAATAAAAAVAAAGQARATIVTAVSSTSDWEPRMIVNSVHSIGHNNLAHTEVLNSEPLRHSDSYPYYAGPNNYNYSDQDDKGLGHYSTATSRTTSATAEIAATAAAAPSAPNQSYLSQITDAYKNAATNSNKHNQNNNYINNNVLPISPNNIMSRINVRPLQNEVTANPTIFNSQYFNTFREIKSTVVTIFQRVQEFVSYMFNFFTTDTTNVVVEGRGKKFKIKKKYKKFLLPLLIAYKLKFFALIPIIIGGLVLLVGSTGMAGFFFALFTAVISLNKSHH